MSLCRSAKFYCTISNIGPLFSWFSLSTRFSFAFHSIASFFNVFAVFISFFRTIWHFHVNWNFIANCQLSHCLSVCPLFLSLSVCLSLSVSLCACLSHFLSTLSVCLSSHSLAGVFLWALLVAVKVAHFQEVRGDMFHTGPISCRYIPYIHTYI